MNAEVKEDLSDFLLNIVETLVSDPDQVQLRSVETQTMIAFEVQVPNSEMGKLIGAEGSTIKSIRHLLVCAARMRNVRVNMELLPSDQEAQAAR